MPLQGSVVSGALAEQRISEMAGATPKAPVVCEQILTHLQENNTTLREYINDLHAFISRTIGQNLGEPKVEPGSDRMEGVLNGIDQSVSDQSRMLGELAEALLALKKIA